MFDVFESIGKRLWRTSELNIDNSLFKAHYRHTVTLLLASSLLVFFRQYFGEVIKCNSNYSTDKGFMDSYCWSVITFSKYNPDKPQLEKDWGTRPYPGIYEREDVPPIYHRSYQWVGFTLALQAIAFHLPYFLWKQWEAGRLRALSSDLKLVINADDSHTQKRNTLVNYFLKHFHQHNFYYGRFVLCELLNFANVVAQIYITNGFLGGKFLDYGTKYFSSDKHEHYTVGDLVFPRVGRCKFFSFGTGGSPERHEAMCTLPVNVLHEKIYLMLWFWYIILAVLSGVALLYRALLLAWPFSRWLMFRARARLADGHYAQLVHRRSQIGDWFVLSQLSKNIDDFLYADFINELGRQVEGTKTMHKNST